MVFDGHGPLDQRCDGFNGSLTSTFFSEQTKVGIKLMLRNKLKTMDETVPDLEPLLKLVDHHKGDQVHDEHD